MCLESMTQAVTEKNKQKKQNKTGTTAVQTGIFGGKLSQMLCQKKKRAEQKRKKIAKPVLVAGESPSGFFMYPLNVSRQKKKLYKIKKNKTKNKTQQLQ